MKQSACGPRVAASKSRQMTSSLLERINIFLPIGRFILRMTLQFILLDGEINGIDGIEVS